MINHTGLASKKVAALLVTLLVTGLAPIGIADAASATPHNDTFNILGGKNGAGWGNRGRWQSVDWLYGWISGETERPLVIGLQEVCYTDGESPQDQYHRIAFVLGLLGYVGDQYGSTSSDPLNINCTRNVNAIFAWGSGFWSTPPDAHEFNAQVATEHRKYICTFPTIAGFFNYVACTAHMTNTNDLVADSQVGQASDIIQFYGDTLGLSTISTGDFNVSYQCNWDPPKACGQWITAWNLEVWWWGTPNAPSGHWEAGDTLATYPTEGSVTSQKLDHVGASHYWHQYSAPATRRIGCCTYDGLHLVSDHYLLEAYV